MKKIKIFALICCLLTCCWSNTFASNTNNDKEGDCSPRKKPMARPKVNFDGERLILSFPFASKLVQVKIYDNNGNVIYQSIILSVQEDDVVLMLDDSILNEMFCVELTMEGNSYTYYI